MESLFGKNKQGTDTTYHNINLDISNANVRDYVDSLWSKFEPYADTHFRTGIRNHFQSRFWEMYFACSLMNCGLSLSSSDTGPDIKVEHEKQNVWFEAVAATAGEAGNLNTVPDPAQQSANRSDTIEIVAREIPSNQIILRLRNAIEEKHKKYKKYCKNGTVNLSDPYVIAVNGWEIRFSKSDGMTPSILQAVFPLGNLLVPVTSDSNDIAKPFYEFRNEIQKSGGATVSTDIFLQEKYQGISAVVYSAADATNGPCTPGDDYVIVHNHIAKNPLPKDIIKLGREYVPVVSEDEIKFETVVWSKANSS